MKKTAKRKAPAKRPPPPKQEPVKKTVAPPAPLSSAERRNLRAQAHHLEPVVQVGHSGVTDAVVSEVLEQLRAHELIKVRLHEPEDKQAMADALAAGSGSTLCGLVGHTAILYKRNPKQPKVGATPAKRGGTDKPGRR